MQSQALGADEQDAVKACYLNVDQGDSARRMCL